MELLTVAVVDLEAVSVSLITVMSAGDGQLPDDVPQTEVGYDLWYILVF